MKDYLKSFFTSVLSGTMSIVFATLVIGACAWVVSNIKAGVIDMAVFFMVGFLVCAVGFAFEMRRLATEKIALHAELASIRAECAELREDNDNLSDVIKDFFPEHS